MKTILFLFASTICFSQTISKAPIYEGANNLTINEDKNGFINFSGQDSEYEHIIKISSFTLYSKKDAIAFIEKAIFMLGMEKTEGSQNISDTFQKLELKRYGFDQKNINVMWYEDGGYKSLNPFNLQDLENIKTALSK
jgi:hypothetical protein